MMAMRHAIIIAITLRHYYIGFHDAIALMLIQICWLLR
jgi:hypothetical protein